MPLRAITKTGPSDLVITGELYRRPSGRSNLEAEVAAFHELSGLLVSSPQAAIQRFLELAMQMCGAGSAGLSLLSEGIDGSAVFRWDALAGAFAPYVGGTTARNFSPCGLCLDAGSTILVFRPARVFEYFNKAEDAIVEGLIVPLYDTGRIPLGTLWVVSHDAHQFNADHARVMEELAVQLVLALKLLREGDNQSRAVSELEARVADKDAVIREVHHRVKNTIQSAVSLLRLQAKSVLSKETRDVLEEAEGRLSVFAKVHELLYSNADNAQEIAVGALLEALTVALADSFSDRRARVTLRVKAEELVLSPDKAIPLAMIANEAITNAYKHAFLNDSCGRIDVSLKRLPDGLIRLKISDDGRGLPSVRSGNTLGIRLIRNFAHQLGATLSLKGAGGTTVAIKFASS